MLIWRFIPRLDSKMPNARIGYNVIGKRIKEARKRAKMDQHALSAALSVDHNIDLSNKLICRIEAGNRPVRDAELIAIANVLNVSPNWLFGEDD